MPFSRRPDDDPPLSCPHSLFSQMDRASPREGLRVMIERFHHQWIDRPCRLDQVVSGPVLLMIP
jgi:hypothetical protein